MSRTKKILLSIFLCCFAITCLLALSIVLTGWGGGAISGKILWTPFILSFYSLVGVTAAEHFERDKTKLLGFLGLGFCLIAALFAILMTWVDGLLSGDGFEIRWRLFVWGIALAHACFILFIKPRSSLVKAIMMIAIGCSVWNTILVTLNPSGAVSRDLFVFFLATIGVFCTIAAPIINRFYENPNKTTENLN